MLAPPPDAQGVARGVVTDWWAPGRRALLEWVIPQAVVLASGVAVLWPLARWLRRVLTVLQQALAAG